MSDRRYLEAQENWVLTIKRLRPGVQDKYDCLMETLRGDNFFWHTPNYQGAFAWGATSIFYLADLKWSMENGVVSIIKARQGALAHIGLEV